MKGYQYLIPSTLIFIAGLIIGSMVLTHTLVEFSDLVSASITAIATLFAAYGGAHYAFRKQEDNEQKKVREAQIVAGNLVIFNLELMWLALFDYHDEVIKKAKKVGLFGYAEMYHTIPYNPNVDINSLSFLIEGHIDLLNKLTQIINNYHVTKDYIDELSDIHLEELRPILRDLEEKIQIESSGSREDIFKKIEELLPKKINYQLHMELHFKSQQVIKTVESELNDLKKCILELTDVINAMYPGKARSSINFTN